MKWWAAAAITFVIALSTIPSAAGYLLTPDGKSWTGILSRNIADVNGYLSIIEEIRQGQWRARNLFTAEPHPPFQIRPYFTLLGRAGQFIPRASVVDLMEAGRVISVTAYLVLLFLLAGRFWKNPRERCFAFLVITLGSGLGWLRLVDDPPDLRIVEYSTFLSLISPPLYTVSLSLIVAIVLLMDHAWESDSWLASIAAAMFALWLTFDRPFSIFTLFLAFAVYVLTDAIRRKEWIPRSFLLLLPVLAFAAAGVLLQMRALQSIPVYAEWNRQHILPTPALYKGAMAAGLLLPLALIGVRSLLRSGARLGILAAAYIPAAVALSQTPVGFQERFWEGIPLFLGLFAAAGAIVLMRRISRPALKILFCIITVAILIPSNIVALQRDLRAIREGNAPQYMPDQVLEAMRALRHLSSPQEAVFSTQQTGNFLVAYSGRPVVLGQSIQTARYPEKSALVLAFFESEATAPRAEQLFRASGATWLFWGPEEAWTSHGRFRPSRAPFLQERYYNGFIKLYRLK